MHTYTHMHGPEVDFWALGLVAYELFYGRRPYRRRCPDTMIAFLNDAQGHFGVEVPPLPIEKQHKAPNRKALDSVSASTEFTFDDDADTEMFDFNEEPVLPNSSGLSALFQSVEDDCVPEFEEPYLFPCGGARPADNTPPLVYMSWNYPVHAGRKDELPPELRVSVPVHSEFLNDNICEEALDLMKGLLDPRPSMRLGGRNGHALRTHQWFEVSTWMIICMETEKLRA
jgi:serine/threonine protein kinase